MKLWVKVALVLLVSPPLLALAAFWGYELVDRRPEAEQYAVYSAYLSQGLRENYHDYGNGRGLLVILDHSVKPLITRGRDLPLISPQMSRDLEFHGLRSIHFGRQFSIPTEYKLVSSGRFDEGTSQLVELTPEEARRSVGGYLTFTRVSFNREGTLALFYTEHLACGLCGGGDLVLMQKQDGRWKEIGEYSPWVS